MHYGLNKLQRIKARWFSEKRTGDALSESEQLQRVKEEPRYIKNIRRPSLAVQLAAVEQDGYYLKFIIDPHVEAQLKSICNPSGLSSLLVNTMEGFLNPAAMARACPQLPSVMESLKAVGVWPSDKEEDLIIATQAIRNVVYGPSMQQAQVHIPEDLDSSNI